MHVLFTKGLRASLVIGLIGSLMVASIFGGVLQVGGSQLRAQETEVSQSKALADSKAGYQDRKNELLESATQSGGSRYAIANLWLNKNIEEANSLLAGFANIDIGFESGGSGYWGAPGLIRAFFIFNEESTFAEGEYAGRLYPYTEKAIIDYMESFLDSPETGKHYENPQGIDFRKGWISENHMALKTQVYLFGSYILGRTEKYNQWKDYWNRLLDYWAKKGFEEIGSGDYEIRTMGPILNVYDFLPDPIVRKKAEMILDWMWAEWAQENIDGVRGGGKIREYTDYASWGDLDGLYVPAYVLFGTGRLTGDFNFYAIFVATTDYYPPDVVIDLAVDIKGRGIYEIQQRRMNLCSNPPRSNARRYAYVTPKYILGGFQSDAEKLYEPFGGGFYWLGQKLWEGVIFDTTPDARIFFEELYSPSETFLYKNVLIISDFFFDWDDPNGWEPHHEAKAVFPDKVLDEIIEDSGWIFVREGDVYVAYKPIGGYMLGELYSRDKYVGKTVISKSEESPAILEVGLASDYNNDFAKFKADIKDNPLSYSDEVLKYTSNKGDALTFYTGSGLPQVNGKTVDWETYPLFESPYINSEWESGYIAISKDERKCTLDFRDFNNPIKTCDIKDAIPSIISVDPSVIEVPETDVGFLVDITITNAVDVSAWTMKVTWDPKILEITSVTEGDFLSSVGPTAFVAVAPPLLPNSNELYPGEIPELSCGLMDTQGANGSGVLLTLNFTSLSNGTCAIMLEDIVLTGLTGEMVIEDNVNYGQVDVIPEFQTWILFPIILTMAIFMILMRARMLKFDRSRGREGKK